jgi:uncharacterized membrane protein SpoIIM required for sporulation
MNEEALVNRKMIEWRRLEELCAKADVRTASLNHEELLEFVKLYKKASTDLSLIRTRSENEPLALYLNNVVMRAHGILYMRPKQKLLKALAELVTNIAQTFRRNRWFFWASFIIFFGSTLVAFFLVNFDRSFLPYFGGSNNATFEQWKSGKMDQRSASESSLMTMFYAGNNPRVSILVGAIGAGSMGIFSILMLFQNGVVLGALASEMSSVDKLYYLLSSIAPHGVPELTGIIFSGAAGLKFGYAILNPGLYSRAESLKRAGPDGLILIIAGVLLCFIAAPIEGFFSFNPAIPQSLKVAFALVTCTGWALFWTFYGRPKSEGDTSNIRITASSNN